MTSQTNPTATSFRLLAIEALRRAVATVRAAETREALADLSDEQLRDIGVDPAAVRPMATLEVEAGLMSRLMLLR